MNNEIKEILERLKDSANNPIIDVPVMGGVSEPIDNSQCLEPNDCKNLLDYITNLQTIEQQYSAILSENAELENKITNLQEENEKLHKELDYADNYNIYLISRIDKALDKLYCYGETFDGKILQQFQKEMLDILQGEDNDK